MRPQHLGKIDAARVVRRGIIALDKGQPGRISLQQSRSGGAALLDALADRIGSGGRVKRR